jgi:hypothetical protein
VPSRISRSSPILGSSSTSPAARGSSRSPG